MNIGILTQPLKNNYGGILQNYALQTVLKREGFEPYTINLHYPPTPKIMLWTSILKRGILKYILHKNIALRALPTKKEASIISHNIDRFVSENIILTEKFHKEILNITKQYAFSAYIVGSDQVWRPQYSPCLTHYFLDFLDKNTDVKKIAYAASFGVDNWEFTPKQTIKCSALAKQFNFLSVREASAIELCKKYLDVDALQVLDPTLLLKKEDYLNLTKQDNIPERDNLLFSYILDKSDKKISLIHKAVKKYNLHLISGMPSRSYKTKGFKENLSDYIFMPVTEWIAGFRDAKFVVTDSFHGTLFSILFNKPFIVVANKARGATRFASLLKMFDLEERLITGSDFDNNLLYLDYSEVNKIIEKERDKSMAYLLNAINAS